MGLTGGGQNIVNDLWPQVRAIAPPEYWEAEARRIVEIVNSHEEEHGLQDGTVRIAAMSWVPMITDTDIRIGYSSSITGVYQTDEALSASVAVYGPRAYGSDTNICTDCTTVYVGISDPPSSAPPGDYTARGEHTATNPVGIGTTPTYAFLRINP